MLFHYLKTRMEKFQNKILTDGNAILTYKEILRFAHTFAAQLNMPKAGILCRSELNAAKAVLACAAAHTTAVPMSYQYGEEHINKIIEGMRLSFLIVDENGGLEIKQIADSEPETENISGAAFIMCTSGTTGSPKGAILTYDNVIANLEAISSYFEIGESDRIMIIRPLYHCAVLMGEYLTGLVNGLDILFNVQGFNPVQIGDSVRKNGITVMCGTPTLFFHILNMAKRNTEALPLRVIALSGECMSERVAQIIKKVLPDTAVYNVYGLTEAGPRVSYLPPAMFEHYPCSVGIPINNTAVRIDNGELLVKSSSVMRGYYGDEERTRAVLNGGWLHTGDLAKTENGLIYILGRKDELIIRGGMNIYPQEIENAVRKDSRITDAMAYRISEEGITQKIGLTVSASDMSAAELMRICRERLPSYQLPDEVKIVDALPRNASGKLIRKQKIN